MKKRSVECNPLDGSPPVRVMLWDSQDDTFRQVLNDAGIDYVGDEQ